MEMIATAGAVQNEVSITLRKPSTPFYGRNGLVSVNDSLRSATATKISKILERIDKIDFWDQVKDSKAYWKNLQTDLIIIDRNLKSNIAEIELFKLEILAESLLPYIEDMNKKLYIDADRFQQIKSLLDLLNHCSCTTLDPAQMNHGHKQHHPAEVLIQADKLLAGVKSGFWKSEFRQLLGAALAKQWSPIIADNQRELRSVGGKLLVLGVAEMVGRPIVVMYPLYLVTSSAIQISNDINSKKQVSSQSALEVIKALMLLWGSVQLLGILGAYSGLGYSCLLLGLTAVFVSMSDSLTKVAAPALSPHFARLDVMLHKLADLEHTSIVFMSSLMPKQHASSVTAGNAGRGTSAAGLGIEDTNKLGSPSPSPFSSLMQSSAQAAMTASANLDTAIDLLQSSQLLSEAVKSIDDEPDYVIPTDAELESVANYSSQSRSYVEAGVGDGLRKRK